MKISVDSSSLADTRNSAVNNPAIGASCCCCCPCCCGALAK